MDQQALIAALMGGQANTMPSAVAPQPDQSQFNPQMLGYGQQMPGANQAMMQPGVQGGMFSPPPYGSQAHMNMTPQGMMGY